MTLKEYDPFKFLSEKNRPYTREQLLDGVCSRRNIYVSEVLYNLV